jgi:hypothetical protein
LGGLVNTEKSLRMSKSEKVGECCTVKDGVRREGDNEKLDNFHKRIYERK